MPKIKATRAEAIRKMARALEAGFAAAYPDGELKGDNNATKAQRAVTRAIAALWEAEKLQQAHNAEVAANIEKLKAELAA